VKSVDEVDDTLYVIGFKNKGKFVGFILNFSLHPDTTGGNLISSDWPGSLRGKIENEFKCKVLILNGPSGDINHINPKDEITRTDKIKDIIADKLFSSFKKILDNVEFKNYNKINTFFKPYLLNFYSFKEKDIKNAKMVLKSDICKDSLKYLIAISLLNIEKEKKKRKKWKLYMNGFTIEKNLCILTLPGEIFTGIGRKIREILEFENVIIAQNSNFNLGYIPTKEAFLQHKKNIEIKPDFDRVRISEAIGINSSYETLPLACKVREDSEDIILNVVKEI
ncbi:MAG: hypothetical protein NC833_06210, partial [Candidatus Omnitrophica bacterium]|nr:hypothetical protein [Candidatus Omnitrophota bacterium]